MIKIEKEIYFNIKFSEEEYRELFRCISDMITDLNIETDREREEDYKFILNFKTKIQEKFNE